MAEAGLELSNNSSLRCRVDVYLHMRNPPKLRKGYTAMACWCPRANMASTLALCNQGHAGPRNVKQLTKASTTSSPVTCCEDICKSDAMYSSDCYVGSHTLLPCPLIAVRWAVKDIYFSTTTILAVGSLRSVKANGLVHLPLGYNFAAELDPCAHKRLRCAACLWSAGVTCHPVTSGTQPGGESAFATHRIAQMPSLRGYSKEAFRACLHVGIISYILLQGQVKPALQKKYVVTS